jgi:hypothetical protein
VGERERERMGREMGWTNVQKEVLKIIIIMKKKTKKTKKKRREICAYVRNIFCLFLIFKGEEAVRETEEPYNKY